MSPVRISLPPQATSQHREAALKYFEKTERLSAADWSLVLETFDTLSRGAVLIERKRWTFRQIYNRYVDARYADEFITQLLALNDPERQGQSLQQQSAATMLAMLEYITRLYDARRRRYVWVVLLTELAWQALDGEISIATLATAADRFPHPVGLVFNERRFVLVTYDLWKTKVKQRQQEQA
ncbi:MAG TPA: hypothetical protein VKA46_33935 [Gemmataceae bacterium]|nr:hypothetical protein [Gemmataceae bacterium]